MQHKDHFTVLVTTNHWCFSIDCRNSHDVRASTKGTTRDIIIIYAQYQYALILQGDEKPRKKVTEINVRKAIKSFARNALTRQEYYRLLALRDPNLFGEIVQLQHVRWNEKQRIEILHNDSISWNAI